MADRSRVNSDTLRVIRTLGENPFQSRTIREQLGYEENSDEAHYMHAVVQRLKTDGVVTPTGPSRKRNQFFMVSNRPELEQRYHRALRWADVRNGSTDSIRGEPIGSSPSAPKRVLYLEDRVGALETKLDQISTQVGELNAQVGELVKLWT